MHAFPTYEKLEGFWTTHDRRQSPKGLPYMHITQHQNCITLHYITAHCITSHHIALNCTPYTCNVAIMRYSM